MVRNPQADGVAVVRFDDDGQRPRPEGRGDFPKHVIRLQACANGCFDIRGQHLKPFVRGAMFQTVDFLPRGGGFPQCHQTVDGFRGGGDDLAAPQGENSLRDGLRGILEERFHCHIVISTRLMT